MYQVTLWWTAISHWGYINSNTYMNHIKSICTTLTRHICTWHTRLHRQFYKINALAWAGGDCIGLLSRMMHCSCLSFLYAAGISVILLQEKSSRMRGRSASSAGTDGMMPTILTCKLCCVADLYLISAMQHPIRRHRDLIYGLINFMRMTSWGITDFDE